ncbi:MAG: ribosome silencing factor [Oligoflexales bacterium]|nr:ribosome silencing factor [Oligoflexales bacterium]
MSAELVQLAIKAAQDKKASRIVLLDLTKHSDVCEYQLICSADNERQTTAIADAIEDLCKTEMSRIPSAIEGKTSGHWVCMDYGSLIVHVFLKSLRDYYAIESLWPQAAVDVP